MPNFKKADGTYQDTAHPLSNDFRRSIEDKVLEAYEEKLKTVRDTQNDEHKTNQL